MFSATYSPDGRFIVTGSSDKAAIIWNSDTGELLQTLENEWPLFSAEFSSNGQFVITSGGKAIIWDATTAEQVRTLEGHTKDVLGAAYSPDGQFLVTTSHDHTAIIWSAITGEPLRTLEGHTGALLSAAYSPDGHFIVTASDDGTARIWDADYHDFIDYACSRVSRDLTANERAEYGITDDTPTCDHFGASNQP